MATAAVVSPTSWPQCGDSSSGQSIFLRKKGGILEWSVITLGAKLFIVVLVLLYKITFLLNINPMK